MFGKKAYRGRVRWEMLPGDGKGREGRFLSADVLPLTGYFAGTAGSRQKYTHILTLRCRGALFSPPQVLTCGALRFTVVGVRTADRCRNRIEIYVRKIGTSRQLSGLSRQLSEPMPLPRI